MGLTDSETLVASVAAQYDDEEGGLTQSALRRLQRRLASSGKVCERCTESKPLTDFSRHARNPDGLRNYCRICDSESYRKGLITELSG